jgi:hypothetical protein
MLSKVPISVSLERLIIMRIAYPFKGIAFNRRDVTLFEASNLISRAQTFYPHTSVADPWPDGWGHPFLSLDAGFV